MMIYAPIFFIKPYYMKNFKPSYLNITFSVLITIYAILDMNKVSEFLYFNF